MEPILSLQHVTFTYNNVKKPTICDIQLDIYPKEKILICGPSGSGKSTLSRCINGLIPHSYKGKLQGEIRIKGKSTASMEIVEISKMVGTILQDPEGQFVGLSVGEDVAFALENLEMPREEMIPRVVEALDKVSMTSFIDHSPLALSGGQKQKVAIAGILALNADILLFDEPLANLDPISAYHVMQLIEELNQKYNKTIIIVEHRIEEVLEIGIDRMVLIDQGRIVADKPVAEVLSSGILKEIGIRHPLYLEALEKAGARFTKETIPLSADAAPKEELLPLFQSWSNNIVKEESISKNSPIISFKDVMFSYDSITPVLKSITFDVCEGERIALLGPNGAGKSTLSHLMLGLLKPSKGLIEICGKPSQSYSISERGGIIGYVMQNPNQMISQERVKDEVAFGPRNFGLAEHEVERRVQQALEICDLVGYKNWPVSALSFGQKKRLTIASVLSMEPKMLLLDEPTAGQDYRHYREMMEFITRLTSKGIAMMLITHDMHLALEYADRSIVLSDGEIIADWPIAELFADQELLYKANLRTTSLYRLAEHLGIPRIDQFIAAFINQDKRVFVHDGI